MHFAKELVEKILTSRKGKKIIYSLKDLKRKGTDN